MNGGLVSDRDSGIGGLAIDDPIRAVRARQLLASAAKAVDQFEDAIRELVEMRAWTVLGYANLADMWEAENGFKCPTYAKVLAVDAMAAEGMKPHGGGKGGVGHSIADVGRAVGFSTTPNARGYLTSGPTSSIISQLKQGVPADKVKTTAHAGRIAANIEKHGTRSRPKPRRTGKTPDELVSVSVGVQRRDDDAIAEIARKADVTKSEIYRQAVTQYLDRLGKSTFHGNPEPEYADLDDFEVGQ